MSQNQQQPPKVDEFGLKFEAVMNTEEGRAVLWWVMERAGTFSPNLLLDPTAIGICEGKRTVGLEVFSRLTPDTFKLMQEEANRGKEKTDDDRHDRYDARDQFPE